MSLGGAAQGSALDIFLGVHQILPCQFYDLSGGHRLTGEQRLMLALLADAINVFQQGLLSRSTRKRMLYVDAERWIMDHGRPHAFSFDAACEALGIDTGFLRGKLVAWKHEANRSEVKPKPPHLRLKITPRSNRMTHRRRRAQLTSRVF